MTRVFVMMTMDCERSTEETINMPGRPGDHHPTGPSTYADSERFIRGYWKTAQSYGFPATFFIHPETAQAHRELFHELKGLGACLGLHLHPWKFAEGRFGTHLGGLSEAGQTDILLRAAQAWEQGLGERPQYFRPGTFSANDSTFRVLRELGFRGGSVSIPGRVWPRFCSVWAGAEPYPHRAHPYFRQLAGDLDFVNVPLSVDFRKPMQDENGSHFGDLRPDYDLAHREVLQDIVDQLARDKPRHGVISIVTHNDHDFSDPDHPWSRRYESVLSAIDTICGRAGLKAVGATVATLCDLVL